jgi:hypothetical protein
LTINNSRPNQSQPAVDIYVHTIITPLSNANSQQAITNNTTNSNSRTFSGSNSSEGGLNNPLDFINLLTNSRHNISTTNQSENQADTQRNTSRDINNINLNSNNNDNNNNRNNLLGHKREQSDRPSDEINRHNLELNGNSVNMSNNISQNLQRNSNLNNIDTIDLNLQDGINNPSSACFDIIVEDYVESGSIDDEDEADGDSHVEM